MRQRPPALHLTLEQSRVRGQQGPGEVLLAEHLSPLVEGEVGGGRDGSVCFWRTDYLVVGMPYSKSKRNLNAGPHADDTRVPSRPGRWRTPLRHRHAPRVLPDITHLYDPISPPMDPAHMDWRWEPEQIRREE